MSLFMCISLLCAIVHQHAFVGGVVVCSTQAPPLPSKTSQDTVASAAGVPGTVTSASTSAVAAPTIPSTGHGTRVSGDIRGAATSSELTFVGDPTSLALPMDGAGRDDGTSGDDAAWLPPRRQAVARPDPNPNPKARALGTTPVCADKSAVSAFLNPWDPLVKLRSTHTHPLVLGVHNLHHHHSLLHWLRLLVWGLPFVCGAPPPHPWVSGVCVFEGDANPILCFVLCSFFTLLCVGDGVA